ncbi:hypothetical protein EVAR_96071_1 [Eumeta japonica]|uniref:MADF domain-containing protein n=1 Tax=Eumeta variegata TaxID=151549 RepID=A0A4C1WAE8_EUMVA|nr:hypothetical protein EVAR_96071_1 [Eumeta japonica]
MTAFVVDNPAMRSEQKHVFAFVEVVKQHPELYDKTLEGYARSGGTDAIWSKVVAKVKEQLNQDMTIEEARSRWRGIRSSYARYKKTLYAQQAQGRVKINKYYLYDALKFLEPFSRSTLDVNCKESIEDQDDTNYAMSDYDPDDNNEEDMEYEAKNVSLIHESETSFMECPSSSRIYNDDKIRSNNTFLETEINCDGSKRSRKRRNETDNLDNFVEVEQYIHAESQELEFFKSIIPDIRNFTPKQKRKFKVRVLQLIDEIEEGSEV